MLPATASQAQPRPTGCGVPGDVFCDGTECLRSDLDDKFQEVEFVVGTTTSAARPGQAAAAAAAARATSVETILELFRLLYLDACWGLLGAFDRMMTI